MQDRLCANAALGLECTRCAQARQARDRALHRGAGSAQLLCSEPFDTAPAIYNFNMPRYFVILLRAREFAKRHNLTLT